MKLKKNVGSVDKIVRYVISAVLVIVGIFLLESMLVVAIGLFVAAAVLLLTALFSFCGLYILFGVNTCKIEE